MTELTTPTVDLAALKAKQQATWASGDYSVVGTTLQIVGERLCEPIDLRAGSKVLDVAAGNGNATLAAARRFCEVTSTDYVPASSSTVARAPPPSGLEIAFRVEDAEALPFPDASFDVVLSTFGVMFTADHAKAAPEMLRVCRPGGTIAMANWTPEGFIGQVFKTIGRHLPAAAGAKSPALWGTREAIEAMFGAGAARSTRPQTFPSATARPSTSSRCSAPGTARPTRPSRRSARTAAPRGRPQGADRPAEHRRPTAPGGAVRLRRGGDPQGLDSAPTGFP